MLDRVYRRTEGDPVFVEVAAPTDEALQAVLHKIITRILKLLTRRGALVEEQGSTYMADNDADSEHARTIRPLQAAACTYRVAFGPPAGQKVLTVQNAMPRDNGLEQALCADTNGFSPHAAVRCGADERKSLEQLCRYITRRALANERVQCNAAGQVVLKLKTRWRDGTTHLVMSPLEFMQRAGCEPTCTPGRPARMSRARLLKRVFDLDLEHCPNCVGELKIIATILEAPVIERILTHLGLQAHAPPQAPARGQTLLHAA